jgi:uncharacterized protein (DUF433 family)
MAIATNAPGANLPEEDVLLQRIVATADVCFGKPRLRGHRLPVEVILGMWAAGWTDAQLLESYPDLEREDLLACMAYAHRAVAGEHWVPADEEAPPPQ